MMNVDAGRQHIRRLPDKPIVGETYPNAGGIYKVDRYDAERDLAWVHSRRTAGSAAHTAPRCTMCRVGALSYSGITARGGQFSADDCGERW